jgi:hypothetical protein
MEFAGLALAIYPATVLAFEQYKKGAKYISDWARYRRKYEAFIRDMEGQQLFFEGILQDLLCGGPDPFLTGSSSQSKDSFLRIATDASFTGWKSPVLKQRLKARLDSRYEWCMYTIKRIYDIMIELGELLDIQAVRFPRLKCQASRIREYLASQRQVHGLADFISSWNQAVKHQTGGAFSGNV